MNTKLFSGEPMPLAPVVKDPELDAFNRKLLEYLRRLVTKLGQAITASGSSVAAYVGTLETDQTPVSYSTDFSVEWTRDIHLDTSTYEHSTTVSTEEITVLLDGVYVFMFDVEHTVDGPVDFRIEVQIGASYYVVDHGYLINLAATTTGSMVISLPLVADTKVRFRGLAQSGTLDGTLAKRSTRLTVLRVATSSDGDGGIGWDGVTPSWTVFASPLLGEWEFDDSDNSSQAMLMWD